jgi:hypothetical protein
MDGGAVSFTGPYSVRRRTTISAMCTNRGIGLTTA